MDSCDLVMKFLDVVPCLACGEQCPSQVEMVKVGHQYTLCSGCDEGRGWVSEQVPLGVTLPPMAMREALGPPKGVRR